jgi:hypothetical protein
MLTHKWRARPKLRFEALEGRLLLSAAPYVKVDHNTLLIRGTDGPDIVEITQNATTGEFLVAAEFNGVPAVLPPTFPATIRNIKVELKKGNDALAIGGITIGGNPDLSALDTGVPCVPSVTIPDTETPVVVPAFTPVLKLANELVVEMGPGADVVEIGGASIGGNARVLTGGGTDVVDIALSQFGRSLCVDTGSDADLAMLAGVCVACNADVKTFAGNDFVIAQGLNIGKKLSVATGCGADQFFGLLDPATTFPAPNPTLASPAPTTDLATAMTSFLTASGLDTILPDTAVAEATTLLTDISTILTAAALPAVRTREALFEMGPGEDSVTISDFNVTKALTVFTGGNNDTLNFADNTYGCAKLYGGCGKHDTLNFIGTNTATSGKTKIFSFEIITGTRPLI